MAALCGNLSFMFCRVMVPPLRRLSVPPCCLLSPLLLLTVCPLLNLSVVCLNCPLFGVCYFFDYILSSSFLRICLFILIDQCPVDLQEIGREGRRLQLSTSWFLTFWLYKLLLCDELHRPSFVSCFNVKYILFHCCSPAFQLRRNEDSKIDAKKAWEAEKSIAERTGCWKLPGIKLSLHQKVQAPASRLVYSCWCRQAIRRLLDPPHLCPH